jgi:hypothetical protein
MEFSHYKRHFTHFLCDLDDHSGERRRTFDLCAARLRRPAVPAGAFSVNLDEGLELVAARTLMFVFADIGVPPR